MVISFDGVRKRFRDHEVLRDVSFTLDPGAAHALVGPNGSGKSVVLRLATRLMHPDEGTIEIDSKYLPRGRAFPDRFGVMIDGPAFVPGASAEENLLSLARIRGRYGRDHVRSVLDLVGLEDAGRKPARRFSLGMKQKLGLATALMEEPEVLVLDEPFNALDEASVTRIADVLAAFTARGGTLLFTSHDAATVDRLADAVLRIDAGIVAPA
jgi:ABC-2 type transport system ATP-binding protein